MHVELISQSKYRDGSRVGDDVPLIVAGQVYGVFDGATDPRGTLVDGIGTGRLAALTIAKLMTELTLTPDSCDLLGAEILRRLSSGLAQRTTPLGLPIPPSTTLAVALDYGQSWRFLALGDTGIRLNGNEILRHEKLIDDVSTTARVAVFNLLTNRHVTLDMLENSARRAIFLGFDEAVNSNVLDRKATNKIIDQTIAATGLDDAGENVREFLNGGIQTQFRLGNATGSPLCFDTMNGTIPKLDQLVDTVRPKSEIQSIEIFSDGYLAPPNTVGSSAWEASFHRAEELDFHKTGQFATVKGSTSVEFFDDRTVLVLSGL